jgi:hypothetical protein
VALVDSTNYQDPLDLLRRFIPTPLRTRFRVGDSNVTVETNDFTLLPALPLDTAPADAHPADIEWKLVRDLDAPGLLEEPLLLSSSNLTVVGMGTACLLGLDHERRELLCFIGPDVDGRTFQEFLVPYFCRLTNQAAYVDAPELFPGQSSERTDV